MSELWRVVPDYPNYMISDHGRVKSKAKRVDFELMTTPCNGYGYPHVNLYNDAGRKVWRVHALVLTIFVGPRPTPKHHTSHYDDVKTNNHLANLSWTTAAENKARAMANGRIQSGCDHSRAKLIPEDIEYILKNYKRAAYRESNVAELALKFGVHKSTIVSVVKRARLEALVGGME